VTMRINPIDQHVGKRVRMRRLMLSLSQTALADALGITFQQVQKYEKGTNRISASRLQHTARILQVPVTFFFEGQTNVDGKVPSPAYISDFLSSTEGLKLVKAFRRIQNPTLRHRIVALVEELAGDGDATRPQGS
jgi:transcriptional regulator with XRE-family HTH domain